MHAAPNVSETLPRPSAKWQPAFGDDTPIVREVSALQEALHVVNDRTAPGPARAAARRALTRRTPNPLLHPILDEVIRTSLHKVAGNPISKKPLGNPSRSSSETHLIETASMAWLGWAGGPDPGHAASELARVQWDIPIRDEPGALHRTTLQLWLAAIVRLEAEDLPEAHRFWKRAIEIGSSLGTESHPAILWSYAASFFP